MDLKTYQARAVATAEPRAYHSNYLIPALVAEFGEVQGHRSKGYWHDKSASEVGELIAHEYGDIAWITAVALYAREVFELTAEQETRYVIPRRGQENVSPEVSIGSLIHRIFITWHDGDPADTLVHFLVRLWLTLEQHVPNITQWSFDEVLQANLDKLASRAERGVLQGNGDTR